ncbi:MAG: 4'-phosphopantetheinyl transferase superfamily protein [Proteobacteria bacterium]|nr:4'-phosphopantetheinyl transferase superfamily protein [Pseudomonadota bacterium]
MIKDILPHDVAAAWVPGDAAPEPLPPEEEAALVRAVEKRRREFALGRLCARRAITALGRAPVPLPSGPSRAPVWPAGLVGSITHCAPYCAAAVADAALYWGVGIDAEPDEPLPPGVAEMVLTGTERAWIAAAAPIPSWDRLVFSAKEAVFKVWHPLTGAWLGFHDADLSVDPDRGVFTATLLRAPPQPQAAPLRRLCGRFLVRGKVIVTAIALPR